jgi:hypothetical protein
MLVRRRRDKRAELKLMCKCSEKQGFALRLVMTDKLRSYSAAFQDLRLTSCHAHGLRKNNRASTHTKSCDRESARPALQVGSIRPAFPQHARRRPQYIQHSTPSDLPEDAADLQSPSSRAMVRCRCSVTADHPCPHFNRTASCRDKTRRGNVCPDKLEVPLGNPDDIIWLDRR